MQQTGGHPGETGDTEQSHVTVDFLGEKGDRTTNAGFSAHGSGKQERPSDKNEACAQSEGFQHVSAPANTSVDHDGHLAGLVDDLRQYIQRCCRVIELPAAMVGHDQTIDAAFTRKFCAPYATWLWY